MSEGIVPEPAPETFRVSGYNPQPGGCTEPTCRSQQTISLCGRYGRRCAEHSPWRTLAAEGRVTEAWAALRAWLGTRGAA